MSISTCPPTPVNESARLAALRSYGILDTASEGAFDDITRLAAHICNVPISVVNFIDSGRQWFKSEIGLGVRETPLAPSICAHAILQPDLFVIPDTLLDDRFAKNPLVVGNPMLRFYAGAPLLTTDGLSLGTVCVLDTIPRELSDQQRDALRALARQVMAQLELRKSLHAAERSAQFRKRLMASLGHDLKTPLRAASYALHRMGKSIGADGMPHLEKAQAALEQIDSEFNAIVAAATADEGAPDATLFPIAEVLDHLASVWARTAAAKRVRFSYVRSSAAVSSHPILLSTIVGNFLSNAVKYAPGGRVVLGVRRHRDSLTIIVADNGIGLDDQQSSHLFDAFSQTDPQSEGLGLGLWIVGRTAALLGHAIDVKSRPGGGSIFGVTVPMVRDGDASTSRQ
ncbi:MAG: GAF domain-containing sensor histidine kinase [Dokdonella sp.]|uniref:sensor histidine kinase n=1 Tax=Dokdonella sp. TaxID=2291710 RepID=UPI0032630E6E